MNKVFATNDPELKILFRIPFTMYFAGKELWNSKSIVKGRPSYKWSKIYLYRKEFDGDMYIYWRI